MEALTHEHWAAIDTLSQGMRDKWKQAETSAIELEQFRGDNYNRALSMLADSGSLPPLLMDPFLQWLAKLAGLQYLDNDGIRPISDSVLQRAVAPEAVKTDFRKYLPWMNHTVILDPTNSSTLAMKKMSSPADDLSQKLKNLSLPLTLLVLNHHPNGEKSALLTITGEKSVQVKAFSDLKPALPLVGPVLVKADKKTGNITNVKGKSLQVDAPLKEWGLLAMAVSGVFFYTGAIAMNTQCRLLRMLVLRLFLGLRSVPCARMGGISADAQNDGGGDGGSHGARDGGDAGGSEGGGGPPANSPAGNARFNAGGTTGIGLHISPLGNQSTLAALLSRQNAISQETHFSQKTQKSHDPQNAQKGGKRITEETPTEDAEDLVWDADRKALLNSVALAYSEQQRKLTSIHERHMDRILFLYQTHECKVISLLSATPGRGGTVEVLCEYNGADQRVVGPNGIMDPGGKFVLHISDYRSRSRWHNDKVLRHAAVWNEMDSRTNHSKDTRQQIAPPLRLFKNGTFAGFASFDSRPKETSLGMTFLGVKHVEEPFKTALQGCMHARGESGELALSDELRRRAQGLGHIISTFNGFGLALGTDAINKVRVDEQRNPVFCNLSGASMFPGKNVGVHSRQAVNAQNFLSRSRSSRVWPELEEKGKAYAEVVIHRLDAFKLADTFSKHKREGYASLNDGKDTVVTMTHAKQGAPLSKADAFLSDQQSLALMISDSLCGQNDAACAGVRRILQSTRDTTNRKRKLEETTQKVAAEFRTAINKASITVSNQILENVANWVVISLHPELAHDPSSGPFDQAKTLAQLAYHPFLTTYMFQPEEMASIQGEGILVGPRVVASGPCMSPECRFVGACLPAIRVKAQGNKGPGLEAAQKVSSGSLIGLYVGEFETLTDGRPASRMVLKLTSGKTDSWGYCFGEENFDKCLAIPALFSYANAPGTGERANCKVDLHQEARYTVGAKRFTAVPVFAIGDIVAGDPLYWFYDFEAGPGFSI